MQHVLGVAGFDDHQIGHFDLIGEFPQLVLDHFEACLGVMLFHGVVEEDDELLDGFHAASLDAVLGGLLLAVANEALHLAVEESFGFLFQRVPFGGCLDDAVIGSEEDLGGEAVPDRQHAAELFDGIRLVVDRISSVLACRVLRLDRFIEHVLGTLEEDALAARQMDALVVTVGFWCARSIEVRAVDGGDEPAKRFHR